METNYLTPIMVGFIALLLGAVFVGVLSQQALTTSSKKGITNELITITSARLAGNEINESKTFNVANLPSGWKSTDCPLTSVAYGNSTTDFTLTTDYLITLSTGVLSLKNSTALIASIPNSTYIDYTYCADDYINVGWGRTVTLLIGGLFSVAIVGAAISILKDIMGNALVQG